MPILIDDLIIDDFENDYLKIGLYTFIKVVDNKILITHGFKTAEYAKVKQFILYNNLNLNDFNKSAYEYGNILKCNYDNPSTAYYKKDHFWNDIVIQDHITRNGYDWQSLPFSEY
jgi:hypothetical protein